MHQVGRNGFRSFLGFGSFLFLATCVRSHTAFSFQNSYETSDYEAVVIGINLGESYSQVAVSQNGTIEIIADEHGRSIVPSYVAFQDGDVPLVGFDAKDQATLNPQNTIYDVRRLMGRNFSDPEVQLAIRELPYAIENQGGQPVVIINTTNGNVTKKPEEIIALIVAKLKVMAENHLGTTVSHTVISVPAYFNDIRRHETKDAAFLGGLTALRLVNEPTSIGIAYRLDTEMWDRVDIEWWRRGEEKIYLFYNVKERDSELTLLSIEGGVFEIHGTVHDRNLGGRNFDSPPEAHDQIMLSEPTISTAEMIRRHIEQFLVDIKRDIYRFEVEVDSIIITGDDKYIFKVQDILTQYLPNATLFSPPEFQHQDQAIVGGVAIQGGVLSGDEGSSHCIFGFELFPLALGIELSTGAFKSVILRNTVLPTSKKILVTTANDGQDKVVLRLFEGQRKVASKNTLLGTVEILGLHKIGGAQEIEVKFDVDVNDTLTVQASGHAGLVVGTSILDVSRSRYQWEEIDVIVEEAERFYEADWLQLSVSPLKIKDGVKLL